MCNWATFVGRPKSRDVLDKALKTLAGAVNKDATGVALFTKGGQPLSFKIPTPADDFVTHKAWVSMYEKARKEGITGGMLHTRNATHGKPEDNANNHPHITEAGSILVHKGIVDVISEFESKGDCDSEQIVLSLDKHGLKDGIQNLQGTACIAYYAHWEKEKQLYLYGDTALLSWKDDLDWVSTSFAFAPVKHDALPKDAWHIQKFDGRIVKNSVEVELAHKSSQTSLYTGSWAAQGKGKALMAQGKEICPHCGTKFQAALEWDMDMCLICFLDAYDKFKAYMGWASDLGTLDR